MRLNLFWKAESLLVLAEPASQTISFGTCTSYRAWYPCYGAMATPILMKWSLSFARL